MCFKNKIYKTGFIFSFVKAKKIRLFLQQKFRFLWEKVTFE